MTFLSFNERIEETVYISERKIMKRVTVKTSKKKLKKVEKDHIPPVK